MKRCICLLFITLLIFVTSSCNNDNIDNRQVAMLSRTEFATDKYLYYLDGSAYLKVFDYESAKSAYLCSKPECKHNLGSCYASTNAMMMFVNNDFLYTIELDDSSLYSLHRRNSDGTDEKSYMSLCKEYNSSANSIASPVSGLCVGDKLYMSYDVEILNADNNTKQKKGIITCINLLNKSETVIVEAANSQFSLNDYMNDKLYFYKYDYSESATLGDYSQAEYSLCSFDIAGKTTDPIFKDDQQNFSPVSKTDNKLYYMNYSENQLYSILLPDGIKQKEDYEIKYADIQSGKSLIYDREKNEYVVMDSAGNISKIQSTLEDEYSQLGFLCEAGQGLVFLCNDVKQEGKNTVFGESHRFFIAKNDFFNSKDEYVEFK